MKVSQYLKSYKFHHGSLAIKCICVFVLCVILTVVAESYGFTTFAKILLFSSVVAAFLGIVNLLTGIFKDNFD